MGRIEEAILWQLVHQVYDIETDDQRMRQGTGLEGKARGVHFDGLRKNYPMRREFRFTKVTLRNGSGKLKQKIERLGFRVEAAK